MFSGFSHHKRQERQERQATIEHEEYEKVRPYFKKWKRKCGIVSPHERMRPSLHRDLRGTDPELPDEADHEAPKRKRSSMKENPDVKRTASATSLDTPEDGASMDDLWIISISGRIFEVRCDVAPPVACRNGGAPLHTPAHPCTPCKCSVCSGCCSLLANLTKHVCNVLSLEHFTYPVVHPPLGLAANVWGESAIDPACLPACLRACLRHRGFPCAAVLAL